jgi:hypothetical protein
MAGEGGREPTPKAPLRPGSRWLPPSRGDERRVAAWVADSPGGTRWPGDEVVGVRMDAPRMPTGDLDSAGNRKTRLYRITVRGEVTQPFLEPLERVFVESTGDESILRCEGVDQAKLQGVLSWLYARGVEILRVVPDDGGPQPVIPPTP